MKKRAGGAVVAQAVQAAVGLATQILVVRLLGVEQYGRFAILYGVVILVTGILTGLIGDSAVVLERRDRAVRAGLQVVLTVAVMLFGTIASLTAWLGGFSSGLEALLFAAAIGAFGVEEIVRRLLMAHMRFLRIAAIDLLSFVIVLTTTATAFLLGGLSLTVLLGGIVAGQSVATLVGWRLLPVEDRLLVGMRRAAWREVLRYGAWRGLQQVLRPSLFTVVRLVVLAAAGAGAVGLLEAARTYASPLLLVVGGLSSFLFVRFAEQKKKGAAGMLREADRMVAALVLATAVMSGFGYLLIPWASPIIFGLHVEPLTVVAWLLYGVSVAFVTPYGALGAVIGRQAGVFLIRFADTALAVLGAVLLVGSGVPVATVPFVLAVASLLGGLALRHLVAAAGGPETSKDRP